MSEIVKREEPTTLEPTSVEPLAVTPEALKERFDLVTKQRQVMTDFVTKNMKENVDYGRISSTSSRTGRTFESKPTLLKPGAEKLCQLFSLTASFEIDHDTLLMAGKYATDQGLLAYVCKLRTRDGQVVGEGRGSCSVASKNGDVNTATKIAEKRAQMDAVLRTMSVSEFFTQDLDDMDQGPKRPNYRMSAGAELLTAPQRALLFRILEHANITKEAFEDHLLTEYNIIGIENVTKQQASKLIDALMKKYGPLPGSKAETAAEEIPVIVDTGEDEETIHY